MSISWGSSLPARDGVDLFAWHPHGARDRNGEGGNTLGVPLGLAVFQVERIAKRLQRDVVRALQIAHGKRELVRARLDQRFQIGLVSPVFDLQPPVFQCAAYGVEKLFALKRLQQIVVCPVANRCQRHRNIMNGCHHHDRHVRVLFLGPLQQADAVEVGHHQVREHEFELFAGGENRQRLHAGTGLLAGISGRAEHRGNDFADRLFVVNYKNSIGHGDTRKSIGDCNCSARFRK